MRYDFRPLLKQPKYIERWFKEHLRLTNQQSKRATSDLMKQDKLILTTQDLIKILEEFNTNLTLNLESINVEARIIPTFADKDRLDYMIWLNDKAQQFDKAPHEYTEDEWVEYLIGHWDYSRKIAKLMAKSLDILLHENRSSTLVALAPLTTTARHRKTSKPLLSVVK